MNTIPRIFTSDTFAFFQRKKAGGDTFTQACKELGWNQVTVRKKAALYGFGEEMAALYPPSRSAPIPDAMRKKGGIKEDHKFKPGEMRRLKPEEIAAPLQVDRNHIYVRSAAMAWRKAA